MITREAVADPAQARDLSLTTRPNWTVILFFTVLSGLHFVISGTAFFNARLEGYLSFMLAGIFCAAAIVSYFVRYEMTIVPSGKCIRLRNGTRWMRIQRFIPFADVHAIRLTLGPDDGATESCIEVLCDNEDIECPATQIPRQQALYLAVLMNVPLIKVSGDDDASSPKRDRLL